MFLELYVCDEIVLQELNGRYIIAMQRYVTRAYRCWPEDDTVEIEGVFDDSSRRDPGSEDVLQRRKVVRRGDLVNAVQVAADEQLTMPC